MHLIKNRIFLRLKRKIIEKKSFLIILLIITLQIFTNYYVLDKSKIMRKYDESYRIKQVISFTSTLEKHGVKEAIKSILTVRDSRKVFTIIGSLVFAILDSLHLRDLNLLILFTNAIYYLILVISIYKIGYLVFNENTGLLAVVFTSFSPFIFSYTRTYLLDFPLTSMIALSILLLLKTNNFKYFLASLFAGAVFAIAQLTKESAIIFLFPIFIYYAFRSLNIKNEFKKRFFNLMVMVLIFLSVCAYIYINLQSKGIFLMLWKKSFLLDTYRTKMYYFGCFPTMFFGLVFTILALPLILSLIKNYRKRNIFLLIFVFLPFSIFFISNNKSARFLMPILPFIFLLMASELYSLSSSMLRRVYCLFLISCLLVQYSITNFFIKGVTYDPFNDCVLASVTEDKDYNLISSIVDIAKKENINVHNDMQITFTFDFGYQGELNNQFVIRDLPFWADCPQETDAVDAARPGKVDWMQYLLNADYVVDKTGDLGRRGALEDIGGDLHKLLQENRQFFRKIAEFEDSMGEKILMYKNINI